MTKHTELKPLIKNYLDARCSYETQCMNMNDALRLGSPENFIDFGMSFEYDQAIEALIKFGIGEVAFDSLMWWIYECRRSGGDRIGSVSDETGEVELQSFDEFYAFAFEGYSVEQILNRRQ